MQFNLKTVLSLIVMLSTLIAAYAQGFLASHPDISAIVLAIQAVIAHFLEPVVKTNPPPAEPPAL